MRCNPETEGQVIETGTETKETRVLRLPRRRRAERVGPVELEFGGTLTGCVVGFECIGPPGAPAVAVLGGISADAHVCAHDSDPRPGWWDPVVGPRRSIDTRRYRVIGMDWLGGTGSTTADHGPSGRLPAFTPGDQAALLAALLDALGLERLHGIVGASYGGMAALAFAVRYPRRLGRAVVISAAHETHPMATALRSVQREIVRAGLRAGREAAGLALARQLAMTTYRTDAEFVARFGNRPRWEDGRPRFPVEEYLCHKGRSFAGRFTAEQYLRLSESLDLHRVDPAAIRVPVTLVSVQQDTLVPPWQMEDLRVRLRGLAELVRISSRYGHDAFLKDRGAIGPVIQSVLGRGAEAEEVAR